jgi:hypothetical protein
MIDQSWQLAAQFARSALVVCCSSFILVPSSVSCAQEEYAVNRMAKEGVPAWSKLIALARCVEGTGSSKKIDRLAGKTLLEEGPITFRVNGNLAAISSSVDDPQKKIAEILCQNNDYEFVIQRAGDGQWGVKQLLWKDRHSKEIEVHPYCNPKTGRLGKLPWQVALAYPCRGVILYITWLPHLATSPSFKIVEEKTVKDDATGKELVQVQFTNKAERDQGMNIESGEMTLDPGRLWQIVDARVNAHEGNEGENQMDYILFIKNEFDTADAVLPYVKRQTLRIQSLPTWDVENVYHTEVSIKDAEDVAPFTLPAFGLPQPERPEKPVGQMSLLYGNVLFIVILTGIFVYRRAFKHS